MYTNWKEVWIKGYCVGLKWGIIWWGQIQTVFVIALISLNYFFSHPSPLILSQYVELKRESIFFTCKSDYILHCRFICWSVWFLSFSNVDIKNVAVLDVMQTVQISERSTLFCLQLVRVCIINRGSFHIYVINNVGF